MNKETREMIISRTCSVIAKAKGIDCGYVMDISDAKTSQARETYYEAERLVAEILELLEG